jgi:hypothetical protein
MFKKWLFILKSHTHTHRVGEGQSSWKKKKMVLKVWQLKWNLMTEGTKVGPHDTEGLDTPCLKASSFYCLWLLPIWTAAYMNHNTNSLPQRTWGSHCNSKILTMCRITVAQCNRNFIKWRINTVTSRRYILHESSRAQQITRYQSPAINFVEPLHYKMHFAVSTDTNTCMWQQCASRHGVFFHGQSTAAAGQHSFYVWF